MERMFVCLFVKSKVVLTHELANVKYFSTTLDLL